jgi:hypothetical protein
VSSAVAADINITVTNDQPLSSTTGQGGLALAPVWFGVQGSSSFSVFQPGQSASAAITTLAELGDTSQVAASFSGTAQTTLASGGAIPQFLPGQSASTTLNVGDPTGSLYLNFAGMVVPSNDFFMANASALQIFGTSGNFLGTQTIQVYGANVWDADTEVTDVNNGPAFIAGQNALLGTQITGGAITSVLSEPTTSATYYNEFNGATTAAGYQLDTSSFAPGELVATITITSSAVPEPASVLLLGVGAIGFLAASKVIRSRKAAQAAC